MATARVGGFLLVGIAAWEGVLLWGAEGLLGARKGLEALACGLGEGL